MKQKYVLIIICDATVVPSVEQVELKIDFDIFIVLFLVSFP